MRIRSAGKRRDKTLRIKIRQLSAIFVIIVMMTPMPSAAAYTDTDAPVYIVPSVPPDYVFDMSATLVSGNQEKFSAPIGASDPAAVEIRTAQDLYDIRNNLSGSYVLVNDIDLAGFNGGEWAPIGDNSTNSDISRFTGTFDGQGFIIKNLAIIDQTVQENRQCSGLFGYLSNATVKNVGLEDTHIDVRYEITYAGGICGYNSGSSLYNCYNIGEISASTTAFSSTGHSRGYAYAGGICGYIDGGASEIRYCYNSGDITAYTASYSSESIFLYAGGICGYSDSVVSNCSNAGGIFVDTDYSVSIYTYAGGISGYNSSYTSNCYNKGNISVLNRTSTQSCRTAGGGINGYSDNDNISNCYNAGDVTAFSSGSVTSAGGICGYNPLYDSMNNITGCSNIGNVTSSSNSISYAGGIYGYSSSGFSSCYNFGEINSSSMTYANSYAGGICGNNEYSAIGVSECRNFGKVNASSLTDSYAGGICGAGYRAGNCYNIGDVSASSSSSASTRSYAGGITASGASAGNCYNIGDVTASSSFSNSVSYAGGISGYNDKGINNCYNTGDVYAFSSPPEPYLSSSSGSYAGGLCGRSISDVSNSYNTGGVYVSYSDSSLRASYYCGAICGYSASDSYSFNISNCYWNIDSKQMVNDEDFGKDNKKGIGSGGGETIPLASDQMKGSIYKGNYEGFDFNSVWGYKNSVNNDYPVLCVFFDAEKLSFTYDHNFDIPSGSVNTEIDDIHVSNGVSGDFTPFFFGITSRSPWLSIDSETGIITGMRPIQPESASTAIVYVYDNGHNVQYITINVGAVMEANDPPVGDVNNDGNVNMQDVLLIYQCFRGKASFTPGQLQSADVNGDGVVNMADVLMVYQYFRGKITWLPAY